MKFKQIVSLMVVAFAALACNAQGVTKKPVKPPKSTTSQGLKVAITHVYSKGPGIFDIDIKVQQGKLKVGDEVDVVDSKGTRYSLKITNLRTPYNDVKELDESEATNYALAEGPKDAKFDADFVMVSKGGNNSSAPTSSNAKFIGKINQKLWKGTDSYGAFSFLKKGSKILGINKPVMQLAFKSMDPVDNRQLTVWIFTSDGKPGLYSNDKIEVLLSGSPVGDSIILSYGDINILPIVGSI